MSSHHRSRSHSRSPSRRSRHSRSSRHHKDDADDDYNDRDRDEDRKPQTLPHDAQPLSESDYFIRNTEFRKWLKDEKDRVSLERALMLKGFGEVSNSAELRGGIVLLRIVL